MSGYTSDFNDTPIQAAIVGYSALTLTGAMTQLYWPATSGVLPPLARLMDITAPSAGQIIQLPPANSASLGTDALLTNRGPNKIFIADFDGNTIGAINSGLSIYFYVSDNGSEAGGWSSFVLGAGTSAANASDLDGYGLVSASNHLNIGLQTKPLSGDYFVAQTDRASLLVWQSGVGTISLPGVSTLASSGFMFELTNGGTGTLTVGAHGSDLIDGLGAITLQPTESCFVVCDQTNNVWYTVGRGRSRLFGYTLLTKVVTTGTVTLTQTEASSTVQSYSGALTGNVNIVLPPVVQIYFITNTTTGVFALTFGTGTGSTVSVAAGQSAVLLCDGTNVVAGNAVDANVPIRLSVYDFGVRGNGSFDDITNLNRALSFAATFASGTRPVDLEFNGAQCGVSGQVVLPGGVGIRNGGLKALGTGSLSATVPVLSLIAGNFKRVTSMIVDCNRVAAGCLVNGADSAVIDRVQIKNFIGYGFGNRAGSTDLRLLNVVCEEWAVGSAGEMDYTQRVAIGFDMQGGDYSAVACISRYCLAPIVINQSGGGIAHWIAPKVHNGSSGTVKPNLTGVHVIAMGGSLSFRDHVIDDAYVEIDTFPGVSFIGGNFRKSSSSSITTAYQLVASAVGEQGGGLFISNTIYTGLTTFLRCDTSGGGSWLASALYNVHSNISGAGSADQASIQRMVIPDGAIASPGVSYAGSSSGWYRDLTATPPVNCGFSSGGLRRVSLINSVSWRVGDGTTAPELQVDGVAGQARGFSLFTAGLRRWAFYENTTAEAGANVGSDLNINCYDDTGTLIGIAQSIERKTGNVTFPKAVIVNAPPAAPTLANGQSAFVQASNTLFSIYSRGSDGVLRHVDLTLAP